MIYLVFSILLSISLMITFKLFENLEIETFPAIIVNYFVCVITGFLLTDISWDTTEILQSSWLPYCLGMSTLFIAGFYLVAITIQRAGFAPASVANKLSMVIPVVFAFFVFGDELTTRKSIGILGAISAVFFVSVKGKEDWANLRKQIFLPISVFFVGGIMEVILKYAQEVLLRPDQFGLFLVVGFGAAGVFGLIVQLVKRQGIPLKSIAGGIALGVPNYFSLYFLMKALETSGWESSQIFPVNSIGIVCLAAITGLLLFNERLSRMNYIGLIIAISSIILIAA